jgi:hypothetical protein
MAMGDWTPWTAEQMHHLRAWQNEDRWHPYTCGGGSGPCSGVTMAVTPDGLVCPKCGRLQKNVHDFSLAPWPPEGRAGGG